jgi:hypothetical protein
VCILYHAQTQRHIYHRPSLTLTLALTLTLTLTLCLAVSLSRCLFVSLSLSHTHTLSLSLTHSLSYTHSHTRTHLHPAMCHHDIILIMIICSFLYVSPSMHAGNIRSSSSCVYRM